MQEPGDAEQEYVPAEDGSYVPEQGGQSAPEQSGQYDPERDGQYAPQQDGQYAPEGWGDAGADGAAGVGEEYGEWAGEGSPSYPKESAFAHSFRSSAEMESNDERMRHYQMFGGELSAMDYPDQALTRAKEYLKHETCADGVSLYNHMKQVLEGILRQRPPAPASFLEELSRRTREARAHPERGFPRDRPRPEGQEEQTLQYMHLTSLQPPSDAQWPGGGGGGGGGGGDAEGSEDEEEQEGVLASAKPRWQDLQGVNRLFDQVGLGLPQDEALMLHLGLRQLCRSPDVVRIRFWGKIFGIRNHYYIAEAELKATALNVRMKELEAEAAEAAAGEEAAAAAAQDALEAAVKEADSEEGKGMEEPGEGASEAPSGGRPSWEPLPPSWTRPPPPFPPLPQRVEKATVVTAAEPTGSGVNKKVYYVSSSPTGTWVALPDVSPAQLVAARQIRRFFTGELNAPVNTFPPFPGKEKHLLRAQIARITSGTHVSPQGFYSAPEELGEGDLDDEEEEEEGVVRRAEGDVAENPRYRSLPLADLLEPTGAGWVHHAPHILRQGRVRWWNPATATHADAEEEEEEREMGEEEDEGQADAGAPEPELGPALLTPISEDASLEATPPWTLRPGCTMLTPLWGSALARSNLWPGAWALAHGHIAETLYMGWGVKAVAHSFTPAMAGAAQREYPVGPEVMEQTDPTPEAEEEWRLAHLAPARPAMEFGEEGLFEEDEPDEPDD